MTYRDGKEIFKTFYQSKIYDVENDVVLIKRNNLVVCSGNSYHNFTSLEDEIWMILGEKMNKIEEVNKK